MATEISFKKLKFYWGLYALVLIPLALVLIFNYYPIFNGFIHIFYHWDGDAVEDRGRVSVVTGEQNGSAAQA